jgi:elongation factor P--beta-lysine ligase
MPVTIAAQKKRGQVIRAIRQFLEAQGFSEVITPFLSAGAPLEPTIYPFVTAWSGVTPARTLYLPISPEREMKVLLAASAGGEPIYTIGHCFRNLEGAGATHHPEFLMLEWYRLDANYLAIIADTKALIDFCAAQVAAVTGQPQRHFSWQTLSVEQLWQTKFGVSIETVQEIAALKKLARQFGYDDQGNWEQIYNQLFLNEIESQLPMTPTILLDFPACLSPLCAVKAKQPWLAQRFEVYLDGLEIGNGNSEQLDAECVRQRFQAEQTWRQQQGQSPQPVDEEMLAAIAALAQTGHQYAGMGLGVDRLVMVLADMKDIGSLWTPLTI